MAPELTTPGLAIRVIWADEDLIELACSVAYGKFTGEGTCYTSSPQLHDFADAIGHFTLAREGQPVFDTALSDGSKACDLRAYVVDKAGHMALHVRLATDKLTARPESAARLELELPVEAWPLSQFAVHLREMARTKAGEAFLAAYDAII